MVQNGGMGFLPLILEGRELKLVRFGDILQGTFLARSFMTYDVRGTSHP